MAEYIVENGVKETLVVKMGITELVDDAIENGVKETNSWNESIIGDLNQNGCIDNVIENGVKETKTPDDGDIMSTVEWMKQNNSTSYTKMIDGVIDNGIKGTINCTWNDPNLINEVINNGIKKTSPLDPSFSTRFIDGDKNND
jgi:hypothetical protein